MSSDARRTAEDRLRALIEKWRRDAADDQRVSFCADELEAALPDVQAAMTRAVLHYTVKGYTAGENTDAKHWRQRAEEAEAQVAALRAAPASAPPEPAWRPIATAPQDGTPVYIYAAEYDGLPAFITVAAYHESGGWCVDELRPATHWMPKLSQSSGNIQLGTPQNCMGAVVEDGKLDCECNHGFDGLCGYQAEESAPAPLPAPTAEPEE